MSETQEQYGNGAEKRPLTAVEWLEDVYNTQGRILPTQFEQAKAMEKEQIMDAYGQGVADEAGEIIDPTKDAEQYYNQSYGKP